MRKPYINIKHIIIEAVGYLFCCAGLIYAFIKMKSVDGPIPTHYNFQGEIDGYGPATTMLILPGAMLAVCVMVTLALHLLPSSAWSTGFKINPGKEIIVFSDYSYMMAVINLLLGIFAFAGTAFFNKPKLLTISSGVLIALTMLIIIGYIVKAYRDNKA